MCRIYGDALKEIHNERINCDIIIKGDDKLPVLMKEISSLGHHEVTESEEIEENEIEKGASDQPRAKSFLKIKSCSVIKETDIRVRNDAKVPYVTGCRWLLDDQVFLCDNSNRNIKIIDNDMNIIFTAPCLHAPFDVDQIDETTGVVTMPEAKALQYIAIKPGFKFKHTKCLNLRCFGVAVHDNNIFVCIDDTQRSVKCIKILTLDGDSVSYITHQGSGSPRYLCLHRAGSRVYYTGGSDKDMFVKCVTKDGYGIFSGSSTELHIPRSIINDEDGNLIVCDDVGKCLQLINSDGVFGEILLAEKDNIIEPKSMCINKTMDSLVIASWKENPNISKLTFYKLEYK